MKRIARNIVIIILLFITVFAGYKLWSELQRYVNVAENTEQISEVAGKKIDFDALKERNPDIRAWIYGEGTVIDYPIMQSHDNDDYLHADFDKNYLFSGTLFADCRQMDSFKGDFNTIVYGHHMSDGSMFGTLVKWRDQSYYDKHNFFYLYTPAENYKLEIVSVKTIPADYFIYQDLNNENYKDQFLRELEYNNRQNHISPKTEYRESDRFVTLSTCAYEFENARCVVICKISPIETAKTPERSVDDSFLDKAKRIGIAIKTMVDDSITKFKANYL